MPDASLLPPEDGGVGHYVREGLLGPLATSIVLLVCVSALHAFFAAAESSLIRAGSMGIGGRGKARTAPGWKALEPFLHRLEALLGVCQFAMMACAVLLGGLASHMLGAVLMPGLRMIGLANPEWGMALSTVAGAFVLTMGLTLFGDLIPRQAARFSPDSMALISLRPLLLAARLLAPLTTFLEATSAAVMRLFGLRPAGAAADPTTEAHGDEDLRRLLAQAWRTGRLPEHKVALLERVFEFSNTYVRQVMVPRLEVASFDRRKSLAENLDLAQRTAHSRYPLVDGGLDTVVGVVHMKDLFWTITDLGTTMPDGGNATSRRHPAITGGDVLRNPPSSGADFLTGIARDVLFVPETMRLDSLLRDFQARKVHMAMVVDEFGGVSGLVTFENVIEEIVGEVQDEFDMEQPLVKKISDREFLLDGITQLDVASEALGVELSSEEADTIGGLLSSELGRLPVTGESVRMHGVEFVVREVRRLRVQRVLARLPAEVEATAQSASPSGETPA